MPDLFIDIVNFLQVNGFAILGIVIPSLIAIGLGLNQRIRKNISYEWEIKSLLDVKKEIESDLEIKYKGNIIKSIQLFTIKFINDGNQPIKKDDYETPIELIFNKNATVLDANIINSIPENLSAIMTFGENKFTMSPILLNPKDSFTIQCLMNEYESFKISERIVGLKDINEKSRKNIYTKYVQFTGVFLMSLAVIIILIIGFFYKNNITENMSMITNLVIIGMILYILPSFWDEEYRKRLLSEIK